MIGKGIFKQRLCEYEAYRSANDQGYYKKNYILIRDVGSNAFHSCSQNFSDTKLSDSSSDIECYQTIQSKGCERDSNERKNSPDDTINSVSFKIAGPCVFLMCSLKRNLRKKRCPFCLEFFECLDLSARTNFH